MIHTDVLKFIEHKIFINIALFEGILNLIFIIKLFLKKKQYLFLYNYILLKFVYYSII